MNKKITIYDLLGLIKDGKAPKKIIYQGNYLEFDGEDYKYYKGDYKYYKGAETLSEDSLVKYIAVGNLNDTVEILQEDKPIIEKLNLENDSPTHFYITNEYGTKCGLTKHSKMIADKLNEVIEFLNNKFNH